MQHIYARRNVGMSWRPSSKRDFEIRQQQIQAGRNRRQGCQHPYFGFQAREMARAQKEANLAATAAATEAYRDPRSQMTNTKLWAELKARTKQSTLSL